MSDFVPQQREGPRDAFLTKQTGESEPMDQDGVMSHEVARSPTGQPVSDYPYVDQSIGAQTTTTAVATAEIPPEDYDLRSFLSFGDLDWNGNVDWARFLDPPSGSEMPVQASLYSEAPSGASYVHTDLPGSHVAAAATQQNSSEPAVGHSFPVSNRIGMESIPSQDVSYTSRFRRGYSRLSNAGHDLDSTPEYGKSAFEEGLERWSICQLSPSPRGPPVRFGETIAHFGRSFGDISPQPAYFESWRTENFGVHERFTKIALGETTRERMLVIMQSFFRWASDLHDRSSAKERGGRPHLRYKSIKRKSNDYLFLPPTPVLHEYLEAFLTSFEPFYPFIAERIFDPNKLVLDNGENTSTLSLLLMIAYGMIRDNRAQYRRLSAGLVTICHSALKKLVERETRTPRSDMTFQSALLCTHHAAFSGDEWLIDTVKAHRYLYLGVSDIPY